jgi:hypothetical protein
VIAVIYALNRTMTRGNGSRPPYELWVGSTPAMHHLCTFGCVAHVKTMGNLKKLDDSSKPTIFVGYVLGSKSYRTYDSATQQVSIMQDVVFDKEAKWNWGGEKPSSEFIIDYVSVSHPMMVTVHWEAQEGAHD